MYPRTSSSRTAAATLSTPPDQVVNLSMFLSLSLYVCLAISLSPPPFFSLVNPET